MLTKGEIESSIYAPVETELDRVVMSLLAVADQDEATELQADSAIQERLEHIVSAPGKRVRPAVTLLTSRLFEPTPSEAVVTMAAAVELLHIATLVHDDMVDSADQRRGRATASNLWGGRVAVLLGDYLFATSATFVCDTGNIAVIRRFAETIIELSKGELTELLTPDPGADARSAYLQRIYNKTASLFTTAAQSGAMLCGADDDEVECLRDYGYNLGMAYQVMDDILDFTADSEELGKPACNDLRQGILTLPSIMLLERSNNGNPVLDLLNSTPDDRDLHLNRAVEQIRENGYLDECVEIACNYTETANDRLAGFADSQAKSSLMALASFASNRLH